MMKLYQCDICSVIMRKRDSIMTSINLICSQECKSKRKESLPKRETPVCIGFWEKKGYSIDEAKLKIIDEQRKRSPRCSEYWLKKGFDLSDIPQLISDFQSARSKQNKQTKEEKQKGNPRSIQYWLTRNYNLEDATKNVAYFQDNTSIEAYCKKYGEIEGKLKYNNLCLSRKQNYTLTGYIARHGYKKGLEIWENKFKNHKNSKIAQNFFSDLYNALPLNIQKLNVYFKPYATTEFGRKDNNKYYFYDFVIPSLKYCIEFNGSFWHADPTIYKAGDIITLRNKRIPVEDIWTHDEKKKQLLLNENFTYNTVWYNQHSKFIKEREQFILIYCDEIRQKYEKTQNNQ